ncbi:putative bifunctional inhibitor/plant lipid transfer protein/seed storage helical [Helianthus annuus]|nr:putative bifunctional inhibitor/plant lipid transfer protein/seed storage helical [Helianthus annuus]
MFSATPSAGQCKKERRLVVNLCKSLLYGQLSSPSCCQRIRASHIECICSVLTPKLADLVNENRFIDLLRVVDTNYLVTLVNPTNSKAKAGSEKGKM